MFYLLTSVISAAYVALMLSYLYGWNKTGNWLLKPGTGNQESATRVSIIIPARNEEHTILNCLSSIYKQVFPLTGFEVIVMDDHSTDDTKEKIQLQRHENLKLISLSKDKTGKKHAISEGIKQASGTLIITTDADCEMGENWLSSIVSFYEERKPKMIVAPVLLIGENSFQEKIQGLEMTALTACACASINFNLPILCSGANLAYEKSAFLSVNGFEGVDKIATGDDIFLMLKVHNKFPKQIAYLRSKEARVFTNPARSTSEAFWQRKRWASKTFSYGFNHITGIAILIFLANFLILFSGIMSAISLKFVFVPAICISAKFLVDFMLLYAASSYFKKEFNPFVFAAASVFYPVYVMLVGFISPFSNYSWKGRRY
ncbi:MAG: glycosyltransferase [Bacteroidetes bacterium]|nr:MAG: glycosyltransferase [Bacteroidota bacterium]